MSHFEIKYRSETPPHPNTAEEQERGMPAFWPGVVGLSHTRTLELPGINPQAEAEAWMKGLSEKSTIAVLSVTPVN